MNTQTNCKHKQTANMSKESIIVNDLIKASSISKQVRRLQHEKRKKMVSDEKANKMRYLTKVYFEQVNKLLLEKQNLQDGRMLRSSSMLMTSRFLRN